jgi:RNA polymerase sigma factor (sigma-70 family)
MDEKTACIQRPIKPDQHPLPSHTLTCDRPAGQDQLDSGSGHEGRRHPERCKPRRTKTPLDADQQGLAVRYLPMARSLAKRMKKSFPTSSDELQSVAFLALVEAAQSFDHSRGVNFATFARQSIWGALCDVREEIIAKVRPFGGDSQQIVRGLADGYRTGGRLIGIKPDHPVGSDLEFLETFENWIGRFSGLQAQAFRHIYLDGKSQKETAMLVGCSVWKLSRMHKAGLSSLQNRYAHEAASGPSKD